MFTQELPIGREYEVCFKELCATEGQRLVELEVLDLRAIYSER
jgi:hypothetical protein